MDDESDDARQVLRKNGDALGAVLAIMKMAPDGVFTAEEVAEWSDRPDRQEKLRHHIDESLTDLGIVEPVAGGYRYHADQVPFPDRLWDYGEELIGPEIRN